MDAPDRPAATPDDKQLSLTDSRTWVEPLVHAAQPCFQHVRVDLRRRQIGVPEHHLDRAQVGAAIEKVRRERVPEDVRADRRTNAGLAAVGALRTRFLKSDPVRVRNS